MKYFWLFSRGFSITTFTALNVKLISRGLHGGTFASAFMISAIWWANAGKAGEDRTILSGLVYALGAACGTLLGMVIGEAL